MTSTPNINKWKAGIWLVNAAIAVVIAIVRAFHGDAVCFLWALGAFIEWCLADYLLNEKKGEQDERKDEDN